jgi:NAD(P)H dehydrogenase (quinone)
MSQAEQIKYLVTGGSGQLSQLVLESLINDLGVPATSVVTTSRNPEGLSHIQKLGIEIRKADFDDAESLEAAFSGVTRMLLVSTNDLGTGKRLAQHQNAVHAASKAGVKHIAYTSLPRAGQSAISFAPDHAGTEAAIIESRIPYTILRNNWYAENLLPALPMAIQSGTWYSAAANGAISYLARKEYAIAAARAIVDADKWTNQTLTLTGSAALTTSDVANLVREILGKQVTVQAVSVSAISEGAKAHGLPTVVADMLASFDEATAHGDLADVTEDFAAVVGRQPQPFSEWFQQNKALFG